MRNYMGYTTTTLFLLCVLFVLYEGFEFMPEDFHPIFGIVFGSMLTLLLGGFGVLKLIAMYKTDILMVSEKKPATRKVVRKD